MSAPIPLRRDFGASQLRGLAKKTKDGPQARRLLALAAIYDGATRTEAAMIGGVGLQIIRDWVLHFNERGPDGLLNGKSPGQPSKLNDVQRQAIAGMIESGPIPAVHGVVRWRLIDLAQWIFEEFRIAISSRHHRAANAKFRIKFKNSNKRWKLKTVLAGRGGGLKKSIFLEALLRDVMGLTKINFNSCLRNDRLPVTIRFADAVGEIMLAAPQTGEPRLPFKFYI